MDMLSTSLGLVFAGIAAIVTAAIHSTSAHTLKHGIHVACPTAIGAMVGWLVGTCGGGVIMTLVTGWGQISDHLGDLSLMVSALAVAFTTAWHYTGLVLDREDPERTRAALKHDGVYTGAMAIFVVALSHGLEAPIFAVLKLLVVFIADDWAIISRYRIHHGIFEKMHDVRVSIATLILAAGSLYAVYWLLFDVNGPGIEDGSRYVLVIALYVMLAPWAAFSDGTTLADQPNDSESVLWSPPVTNAGSIVLFCSSFIGFLVLVSAFSAARQAPTWLPVDATILERACSVEFTEVDRNYVASYYPAVRYTYIVGDKRLPGDVFSLHPDSYGSKRECLEAIDAHLPQDTATAYYSPENPKAAVLVSSPLGFVGGLKYVIMIVIVLAMALASIVIPAWGASEA